MVPCIILRSAGDFHIIAIGSVMRALLSFVLFEIFSTLVSTTRNAPHLSIGAYGSLEMIVMGSL